MKTVSTGDAVKHPAFREPGRVRTVLYDFRRRPTSAWVEFVVNGVMQARQLRVADLTPAPAREAA